jgi:hypothetical protein
VAASCRFDSAVKNRKLPPVIAKICLAVATGLTLCAGVRAQSEEKKEDPAYVMGEAFGFVSGSYSLECYFTLADIERSLNTKQAASYQQHLETQAKLLAALKDKMTKVAAAYPDDKEVTIQTGNLRELASDLRTWNEALHAYITGNSKSIETIRKKHAECKKTIVRVLSIEDGGKNLP